MNVVLETKQQWSKKRKFIYIAVMAICLLSVLISAYVIVKNNENKTLTEHEGFIPEEEYLNREEEFEKIFSNEIINQINKSILITNKIKNVDDIVGIAYENKEKITGKYSLNVKVPYINIKNSIVRNYNKEIEKIFKEKALSIISNTGSKDIVYTVDYVAYINQNNILSIAIRSILKEGNNAQRTIIQTYNYDFKNNKEITLEQILELKGLDKKDVEAKIINKIKQEQERIEELKKLGYNIFERDYTSDMYKLENTTEFFIGEDGFLYLIYAYGNDNYTSELDIVIF